MDNFLSICICALHVIHLSQEISKMKSTKKCRILLTKRGKNFAFFSGAKIFQVQKKETKITFLFFDSFQFIEKHNFFI